ncbi:MAG TPA: tRNA (guanosine(37)-N1)-methyltransferase TrmD [Ignavibacteria bacterium]|nr:tRNA (guanosine(37)-N1)-methyltransferase TrmD [Ignavibacteria bacterium]HMR39005.1 tRNA (guanosine(37)-N1)-methyltransferase TrmD [Ignavibacteria bacterium]
MKFDIVSANVNILESSLKNGLISRAVKKDLISIHLHNLRDYAEGKYKQIDDAPYGGGTGMILKPEPVFRVVKELKKKTEFDEVIFFSPQGKRFDQSMANEFSLKRNILIICGHYKGIDERVISKLVTREISIGDYVLSCGDIAAYVFIDAVSRLIPGVLGDGESAITDSFQVETGFDHPQYTRPEIYEKMKVPDVLLSGNHKEINIWREKKALAKYKKILKLNKKK